MPSREQSAQCFSLIFHVFSVSFPSSPLFFFFPLVTYPIPILPPPSLSLSSSPSRAGLLTSKELSLPGLRSRGGRRGRRGLESLAVRRRTEASWRHLAGGWGVTTVFGHTFDFPLGLCWCHYATTFEFTTKISWKCACTIKMF